MSFQVGDRVVCVDTKNWRSHRRDKPVPVLGHIYTIAQLGLFSDGKAGVILSELGKCGYDPYQPDWLITRFRPVIERKADISIFTAMLTPSPTKREPVASNHDVTALNDVLRRSIARMTAKLRFEGESA